MGIPATKQERAKYEEVVRNDSILRDYTPFSTLTYVYRQKDGKKNKVRYEAGWIIAHERDDEHVHFSTDLKQTAFERVPRHEIKEREVKKFFGDTF